MWKISVSNPNTSEPVYRSHQGKFLMRRESKSAASNTEKSVSAIIAAEIFISTSSEEADEGIKLPKLPIITIV